MATVFVLSISFTQSFQIWMEYSMKWFIIKAKMSEKSPATVSNMEMSWLRWVEIVLWIYMACICGWCEVQWKMCSGFFFFTFCWLTGRFFCCAMQLYLSVLVDDFRVWIRYHFTSMNRYSHFTWCIAFHAKPKLFRTFIKLSRES